MNNQQEMFNQINAILNFLPESEKNILPEKLIDFFKTKSSCPPEETLNISCSLEEQDLTDETMLMLYYINNLLKDRNR